MGLLVAAVELVGFDGTDDGDLVAGAGLVGPGGRGDELDGALRGGDHEQALGAVVGVAVNGQVGDHGPGDGQFLPFLPEPLVGCRLLPVGQIEGSVESLVGRNGRAEQPQLARPDGGGTFSVVRTPEISRRALIVEIFSTVAWYWSGVSVHV